METPGDGLFALFPLPLEEAIALEARNAELQAEVDALHAQKREMQDEIRRTTAESRALLQRMGVLTSTMKAAGRFRRNIMLRREQNPSVQTALDALVVGSM